MDYCICLKQHVIKIRTNTLCGQLTHTDIKRVFLKQHAFIYKVTIPKYLKNLFCGWEHARLRINKPGLLF